VPFDGRVVAFALASLVVTGVLVGFAPALRLAASSLKGVMSEGGRSFTASGTTHRTLKTMIIAEIALAITLVAGAGWLVKSFANLGSSSPGFVAQGRLVFDVLLPPSRIFPPQGSGVQVTGAMIADRFAAWTSEMSERLGSIGGVKTVATTATLPLGTDRDAVLYIGVQGEPVDPEHPQVARAHRVSHRFFEAMGVKTIAGRSFTADDRSGTAPVAIVNRTFARRYLAGKDPLTARFTAGYPDVPAAPIFTIVGVMDDVKYVSMGQAADPAYYTPAAQSPYGLQTVVIETALGNPVGIAAPVRAAMKEIDPLIPVTPRDMTDVVSRSLTREKLGMTLMMLFAFAALGLAAIGIYGVISYASSQRVGEIATRMALGATSSHVFWMLMNQGRALAIAGTLIGLGIAYAAGRGGSSLLYEVRASDPVVLLTATALVAGITFVATLLPAIRGSRVQPSRILRLD
jgi:putative ABC transport system permease protein